MYFWGINRGFKCYWPGVIPLWAECWAFHYFFKIKTAKYRMTKFQRNGKKMYILEQTIPIPEVDHFLLALNWHPEIVSFMTRPIAHSSNTRFGMSIIWSNLFHQKSLSCRSILLNIWLDFLKDVSTAINVTLWRSAVMWRYRVCCAKQ